MGSNSSTGSVVSGQVTSFNTNLKNNTNPQQQQKQHKYQILSRDSQCSKSSPVLKHSISNRSTMKRFSRSVPHIIEEYQWKEHQQDVDHTDPTSNDSPTAEAKNGEKGSERTTFLKSKSRPHAISYSNFLNYPNTLIFSDGIQDRYFDRYYPPLSTDIEEKLRALDKKARPKIDNEYTKAKSASSLTISVTPTESSPPQSDNGNNTKSISPIFSLYSQRSPNNNTTNPLNRSNSHSFGSKRNVGVAPNQRNSISPTNNNNTLQPQQHSNLHRSYSHSTVLSNNRKTPNHSTNTKAKNPIEFQKSKSFAHQLFTNQ